MATKLSDARALATVQPPREVEVVDERSPLLTGSIFDAMWRLADAMAKAKTLPEHLRGSPGDCLRIVEYAHRCGYSPYALADASFLVGGKLAFEGKAIAAMVNASPRIDQALNYRYVGEGDGLYVIVSGRRRGEQEPRTVTVTLAQGILDSKGAKARWLSPGSREQMLAYYGGRVWARRHSPEIILGLYTPDEMMQGGDEMIDITPRHEEPTAELHSAGHDAETGEVHEETPPKPNGSSNPELKQLYRDAKGALERDDFQAAVKCKVRAFELTEDATVREKFDELFAEQEQQEQRELV